MVRKTWYAAAAVTMVAVNLILAGCLFDAPDRVESPSPSDPYRFSSEEPKTGQIMESGSFELTDTVCLIECVLGEMPRSFDLAEILPVGVPALLNLTTEHEPGYPVYARLRADGAAIGEIHRSADQNMEILSTTVYLPDDQTTIHADIYPLYLIVEPDGGKWKVRAESEPLEQRLPANFPVMFEIPDPGTPPRFGPTEKTITFLLWEVDDRFLGVFNTTDTSYQDAIRSTGEPGAYVVSAPESGNQLRIFADQAGNTPVRLKVLETATNYHEWHPGFLDEPAMWDFELERVPLATGIAARSQEPGLIYHMEPEIHLETPTGKTYHEQRGLSGGAVQIEAGPPLHLISIQAGDGDHVPGTYHATFVSNGQGHEATHFTRDYVRP